jgi:hypothetical protein
MGGRALGSPRALPPVRPPAHSPISLTAAPEGPTVLALRHPIRSRRQSHWRRERSTDGCCGFLTRAVVPQKSAEPCTSSPAETLTAYGAALVTHRRICTSLRSAVAPLPFAPLGSGSPRDAARRGARTRSAGRRGSSVESSSGPTSRAEADGLACASDDEAQPLPVRQAVLPSPFGTLGYESTAEPF